MHVDDHRRPGRDHRTDEQVLSVVRPDRGALPSVGAGGTLLAMTVRIRRDAPPGAAAGPRRTAEGLPVEAARGQRVRVWSTADGTRSDPFDAWTASWGASWSPDRQWLAAFVHRASGAPSVAVWDPATGVVRDLAVTADPQFTFERPQWVLDGTAVAVATRSAEAPTDPTTADVTPVRVLRSEPGSVGSDRVPELGSADLTVVGLDGSHRVLATGWTVRSWRASPDGGQLAGLRLADFDTDRYRAWFDLEVIDLRSGVRSTPAGRIGQSYGLGLSWSPDGRRVAFVSFADHRRDELWVVEADGRTPARKLTDGEGRWAPRGLATEAGGYQAPRWLGPDTVSWHQAGTGFLTVGLDGSPPVLVATPDGQDEQWLVDHDLAAALDPHDLRTVRNTGEEFCLDRLDLVRGVRTTLARRPGSVSTGQLLVGSGPDGGAFLVVTPDQPGELWLSTVAGPRRLAALNPLGPPLHTRHRIGWSRDGSARAVGLLVPDGPAPARGWPTVVCVYGGSARSSEVEQFDPDDVVHASLLTSRGWAVLHPDLPMTDTDPLHQFAPLVREALDRADARIPIDRERLAVIGNSYGSYTTVSLLATAPTVFRAAAVTAPLINPIASYAALRPDGSSLTGYWENGQGRMGAAPWADPGRWVENTPFLRLDRVITPVLIGVGDHGMPGELAQAEQLFSGLRRLDRPVELRHYRGEGHSPTTWSPRAYGDFADRVVEFIAVAFDPPVIDDSP